MSELPKGWERVPLGKYIKLKNGFAFKSKDFVSKAGNTYPVIRISDIQNGKVSTEENAHVIEDIANFKFTIDKGDLLIAMSGATTGKTGVYTGQEVALQNQRVGNLKLVNSTTSCPRYRNYLIASLKQEIIKKAYGAAQPNISAKELESIEVNIAPFEEQKRIADKLDSVLAKVEAAQARLDKIPAILKRFRQSVLAAATSGELTKEWREERQLAYDYQQYTFDEILVELRNGLSAKPNEDRKGTPILRISSVRAMEIDQADIRYLELAAKEIEKYKLKVGDLLFTRYNGSLEFVGVCGVLENLKHDNLVYPDKLIRARLNEKALPKFIEILFSSPYMRDQVTGCVKTTSGQKGISGKDLKEQLIKLPSVSEQNEIVIRVTKLLAKSRRVEEKYAKARVRLDSLTQSILSKAFSGKLS